MNKFKFKQGDIVSIKTYHDVDNHCGLPKETWERMYGKKLFIVQRQSGVQLYYRVKFDDEIAGCKRSLWVTENSLISQYNNISLPDILDYI